MGTSPRARRTENVSFVLVGVILSSADALEIVPSQRSPASRSYTNLTIARPEDHLCSYTQMNVPETQSPLAFDQLDYFSYIAFPKRLSGAPIPLKELLPYLQYQQKPMISIERLQAQKTIAKISPFLSKNFKSLRTRPHSLSRWPTSHFALILPFYNLLSVRSYHLTHYQSKNRHFRPRSVWSFSQRATAPAQDFPRH